MLQRAATGRRSGLCSNWRPKPLSRSCAHRVPSEHGRCYTLGSRSGGRLIITCSLHLETPLISSDELSRLADRPVFLKLENLQPSGSFKIRGIGYFCEKALARGCRHLVIASGGNAGMAVAWSGRILGLAVTVVVPSTTPVFMKSRIEDEGAEVVVCGGVWDEADAWAQELANQPNTEYVPPFDDADVWEGNSTMIDEIRNQLTQLDDNCHRSMPGAVIASVGGGGLLLGCCVGMERAGWDAVPVIAAETDGAASFAAARQAGQLVTIPAITSIAKSLGAKTVSAECMKCMKRRRIDSAVVSDKQAVEACLRFAVDHRALVEPACGASLAAVYCGTDALPAGDSPIIVIVCGGNMVTPGLLQQWVKQTGAADYDVVASSAV